MPDKSHSFEAEDGRRVDLKDPLLAAFLAWLIPGAGHLYQGRSAKGVLFLVCILGTFSYGVFLGEGRVVYASMRQEDRRLPYFCQIGAGLPALPALVQARRVRGGDDPLWNGFMAPPRLTNAANDPHSIVAIHKRLHHFFELGTAFTMIAGLLNILAIYDAWGGPALVGAREPEGDPVDKRAPTPDADDA